MIQPKYAFSIFFRSVAGEQPNWGNSSSLIDFFLVGGIAETLAGHHSIPVFMMIF